MSSLDHYEQALAEVYDWMRGGWDEGVQQQRTVFDDLSIATRTHGALAIDVGAGTGYQAIPLAERGFQVIAIDPSPSMRNQLERHIAGLDITVTDEPLAQHMDRSPELICCMGDTLAHFESLNDIDDFFDISAQILRPGGQLLLSYRNTSTATAGHDRFIPVRSDRHRLLTCFLETVDDKIRVHDIIHTRHDSHFEQHISSYLKLRLDPAIIGVQLQRRDFVSARTAEVGGFVTTLARMRP